VFCLVGRQSQARARLGLAVLRGWRREEERGRVQRNLVQVSFCRYRLFPTGELGYRGIRGAEC
jgi:hypothetical protein